MKALSEQTTSAFLRRMIASGVPESERPDYLRWARFYLDFCQKYEHPPRRAASLAPFLMKLTAKHQTEQAREQAGAAIGLLLAKTAHPASVLVDDGTAGLDKKGFLPMADKPTEKSIASPTVEGGRASWEREFRDLTGAIKLRNYSGKTLQVYRMWVQKLQVFTGSKAPGDLDTEDVKRFLTDLAVRQEVAGSTQNQAFNALLFFYRHVLRREFGKLEGVVRAKRKPYVPVVLSRQEVQKVIGEIAPPYRLAECLELRVHCFNLDDRLLTIHDGKGQKDRTVPLPERILPEIREQMEDVRRMLQIDLAAGAAGTFLPGQLEKKYKNASKEWRWQWFFPASTLTQISNSSERRRYHLHHSHMQAAVKRGADAAGVTKRVSPHTFRHTFASHLLMAGYDFANDSKAAGTRGCEDDDDLCANGAGDYVKGGAEPAGCFVIAEF